MIFILRLPNGYSNQGSQDEDGHPGTKTDVGRLRKLFFESVRLNDEFERRMVKISKQQTEADTERVGQPCPSRKL